jgi:hypothetical protein
VPVSVLADTLTADDIAGYQAFYGLEPWGAKPADIRHALLSHIVNRSLGGKSKPEDFFPQWGPKEVVPGPMSAREAFTAWARSINRGK